MAVELSAQCTDKKVNEVTARLFKKYKTLGDYLRVAPRQFEKDIFQTGFYRSKTKNILAAAKLVQSMFHGRVPATMDELLLIPGVGRKTANVILGHAYGVVEGVVVDTHVRRLARQLGLSRHGDPEKIERDLMALFPKKEWFAVSRLLIAYGRAWCPARSHDHSKCRLAGFDRAGGI